MIYTFGYHNFSVKVYQGVQILIMLPNKNENPTYFVCAKLHSFTGYPLILAL